MTARLGAFAAALREELGGDATVEGEPISDGCVAVSIHPRRAGALPVSWIVNGPGEVILQAGHNGGRWELELNSVGVDFLEDVTRSVIAGRVIETFAWRRTRVQVMFADGHVARETGGDGLLSLLPLPGWTRWGKRVRYPAYR